MASSLTPLSSACATSPPVPAVRPWCRDSLLSGEFNDTLPSEEQDRRLRGSSASGRDLSEACVCYVLYDNRVWAPPAAVGSGAFVLQTLTHFRGTGLSMEAAHPQHVSVRMNGEQGQVPKPGR